MLVSSGAVTLGAAELGIHRSRLKDASVTRACAAVGQCKLMQAYAESFRPHGIKVAQVLVTEDDFSDLKRYSILRQTFERLLKLGAVPIVNENDTVTNIYTEQAPVFRDNDRLAALVLSKLDADALVLLSNVDGLLYSPNGDLANATVVTMVTEITAAIRDSARGTSATGRGGMTAKLDAAEIAMQAGGMVVIANGKTPGILERVFQGEEVGTLFLPGSRMAGKRRWLAFATTVRGQATINANAAKALLHRQASLLISGVTACEGEFSAGQVIAVLDPEGNIIGKGIAELGSQQLRSNAFVRRKQAWRAGAPRKFSDPLSQGSECPAQRNLKTRSPLQRRCRPHAGPRANWRGSPPISATRSCLPPPIFWKHMKRKFSKRISKTANPSNAKIAN